MSFLNKLKRELKRKFVNGQEEEKDKQNWMKIAIFEIEQAKKKTSLPNFSLVPGWGLWGVRQCFKTSVPKVIKTRLFKTKHPGYLSVPKPGEFGKCVELFRQNKILKTPDPVNTLEYCSRLL